MVGISMLISFLWSFWYPSHWNSWVLQRGIGGHFACFQPQATSNGISLYTFRSTSSGPSHLWEDKKQNRKQKHTHTSIKKDLKHSPFPPEIHVKVFDFLQHCPLDLGLGICTILDLVRTLVWASLSFLLPTSSAPLRTASVKVQLKLWWWTVGWWVGEFPPKGSLKQNKFRVRTPKRSWVSKGRTCFNSFQVSILGCELAVLISKRVY